MILDIPKRLATTHTPRYTTVNSTLCQAWNNTLISSKIKVIHYESFGCILGISYDWLEENGDGEGRRERERERGHTYLDFFSNISKIIAEIAPNRYANGANTLFIHTGLSESYQRVITSMRITSLNDQDW